MESIITFVQVSDLHVGNNAGDLSIWRHPLEYFLGHDKSVARRLVWFYRHEEKRDPAAFGTRLIVTGDLTSHGARGQLELAGAYLSDAALIGKGGPCGLGAPDWHNLAVSGNHDYWDGKMWPVLYGAPSTALATTMKRSFPTDWSIDVVIGGRTVSLRFLAIDTDAECTVPNRIMAQGAFENQIYDLEDLIPEQPAQNEIRILLLHHSLGYNRRTRDPRLQIVEDSQAVLEEFLADYGVRIMLCGHTHDPRVQELPVKGRERRGSVLEACCGTTLQHVRLNARESLDSGVINGRINHNALVVHRLYEESGVVKWQAETYILTARNFQLYSKIPALSSRTDLGKTVPLALQL